MEKQLSLKNEEVMASTLDEVVQRIADGKMTPKQGDVVNTSAKQVLRMHDLKLKYLNFYYTIHKKAVDGGSATIDMVFKKLPSFFEDDAKKAVTEIKRQGITQQK